MHRYLIVLFLGILFLNQGCLSRKKLVYLQDTSHKQKHQKPTDTLSLNQPIYLIRSGDVLYVNVTSYKGELSQFFNQKSEAELNTTSEYLEGYVVSQQGKIKLPVLDSFTVAGKSLLQIQIQLADSIHKYIQDADVIVKLASFHFTVLGEVRNPGLQMVRSDQLTILEALGMAGDLTIYGERRKIRIYRKELNSTSLITVDLTDRNLLASPYYYILPNDVIYVEPATTKMFSENVKQFSFIAGIVSVVYIAFRISRL